MKLLPEDYAFIERIQSDISEDLAIPLEIKPERILKIIEDSAHYFYEWMPAAIIRKMFMIKRSDIDAARDINQTIESTIELPHSIKFIYRIHRLDGNMTAAAEAKYLSNPLMNLDRFGALNGSMSGTTLGGSGGASQAPGMVDVALSLYEYATLQHISNSSRGISHNWSEITSQLTLYTQDFADIVIEAGYHVPVTKLYGNPLFRQYVKGHCMVSLARIIGTYDFKLVGDVSINYADMKEDGKELITEVKEELKTMNTNNFILTN